MHTTQDPRTPGPGHRNGLSDDLQNPDEKRHLRKYRRLRQNMLRVRGYISAYSLLVCFVCASAITDL